MPPTAPSPYNAQIQAVPMPWRIKTLPVSDRGFPVPFFVAKLDGKWDFRVIGPDKVRQCYKGNRCWVCGHPLGRYKALAIGPMCMINRISSEPGSHKDCILYALQTCPFLINPRARRNEVGLPEARHVPGIGNPRNPGIILMWVTERVGTFNTKTGPLFTLDDPPTEMQWWKEKRLATSLEIHTAVGEGIPILMDMALKDGKEAVDHLNKQIRDSLALLDRHVPREAVSV